MKFLPLVVLLACFLRGCPCVSPKLVKTPTLRIVGGTSAKISNNNWQIAIDYQGKFSGWGLTSASGNFADDSDDLQETDLPIVDKANCSALYKKVFLNGLTQCTICAGNQNENINVCRGDYGGPVTRDKVLYGIISHGACGEAYPVIFTDVFSMERRFTFYSYI